MNNPTPPLDDLSQLVRPESTALVLWDMLEGLAGKAPNTEEMQRNVQRLIEAADRLGMMVIWTRHTYVPLSLLSGPWQRYLMRKNGLSKPEELEPILAGSRAKAEFFPHLKPSPNHIVIEKCQPSLLLDTPVENYLAVRNIKTLVLTGFATDIGIDFTARHAHARGYYSVVAEDACGAYTAQAHEHSLFFLRKWVDVVATDDIVKSWASR